MTSIRTSSTIVIQRPVSLLFEYVRHPESHQRWWSALDEVEAGDGFGEGVSVRQVFKFLGRRMKFIGSVVEFRENELIVISGTDHTDFEWRYSFEPINEGAARLTQTMEIDTRGAWKLGTEHAREVLQNEVDLSLRHLKVLLEADKDLHAALDQFTPHRHK